MHTLTKFSTVGDSTLNTLTTIDALKHHRKIRRRVDCTLLYIALDLLLKSDIILLISFLQIIG